MLVIQNEAVKEVLARMNELKARSIEVSCLHVYVFHCEAETGNEESSYYVNLKVVYSFGEQDTYYDGITSNSLEEIQSHLQSIVSELKNAGIGDEILLVDIEPN